MLVILCFLMAYPIAIPFQQWAGFHRCWKSQRIRWKGRVPDEFGDAPRHKKCDIPRWAFGKIPVGDCFKWCSTDVADVYQMISRKLVHCASSPGGEWLPWTWHVPMNIGNTHPKLTFIFFRGVFPQPPTSLSHIEVFSCVSSSVGDTPAFFRIESRRLTHLHTPCTCLDLASHTWRCAVGKWTVASWTLFVFGLSFTNLGVAVVKISLRDSKRSHSSWMIYVWYIL